MLIEVGFHESLLGRLVTYLLDHPGEDCFGWGRTQIILPTQRLVRHLTNLLSTHKKSFILPQMACLMDLPEPPSLINKKPLPPRAPLSLIFAEIKRALHVQKDLPGLAHMDPGDILPKLKHLLDTLFFHDQEIPALPFPDIYAQHWAKYGDLFAKLKPMIADNLSQQGFMYPAHKTRLLWEATLQDWQEHPPSSPIVLCGVLGTYPKEQQLIQSVINMDRGVAILQGTHHSKLYHFLTHKSEDSSPTLPPSPVAISCPTLQDEAETVALLCHHRLSMSDEKLVIVTPDQTLKQALITSLERWGIFCDDSQGMSWSQTILGRMILSLSNLDSLNLDPTHLLDFLKNPYTTLELEKSVLQNLTQELEIKVLRDKRRVSDLYAPLKERIQNHTQGETLEALEKFYEHIEKVLGPYLTLKNKEFAPFKELVHTLHQTFQKSFNPQTTPLTFDENRLKTLLDERLLEIQTFAHRFGTIAPRDFSKLLQALLQDITMTTTHSHPRLRVIVPQEIISVQDETLVMAGCNQDLWHRPSQGILGISDTLLNLLGIYVDKTLEETYYQNIALFRSQVILTRSQTRLGEPMHPAHFWEEWTPHFKDDPEGYGLLQTTLKNTQETHQSKRPAPFVPTELRPRELSISAVGNLSHNPYHFYLEKVLGIEPLEPLKPEPTPALYGSWIHGLLENAISPQDLTPILKDLEKGNPLPKAWNLKAQKILGYLQTDPQWAHGLNQESSKIQNELFLKKTYDTGLGEITIKGRLDRLYASSDKHNPSLFVVDYKSGKIPSKINVTRGEAPQLPLLYFLLNDSRDPEIQASYLSLKNGDWSFIPQENLQKGLAYIQEMLHTYMSPEFTFQAPDEAAFGDYEVLQRTRLWGVAC